jgi:hypothetical protein
MLKPWRRLPMVCGGVESGPDNFRASHQAFLGIVQNCCDH